MPPRVKYRHIQKYPKIIRGLYFNNFEPNDTMSVQIRYEGSYIQKGKI